jgi:hypothetical protein
MVKPLEYEMCKEIETVKHLMFECTVARLIWDDVFKIFDIDVTDFESVASKWLCNKKFLHFNLVSSVVIWTLWINRNNLLFNKTTWLNINQVWCLSLSFQKDWKVPFKDLEGGERIVHGFAVDESQKSAATARKLTYQDFEWVATWRSTSSSVKHGGRASLEYLRSHPEESRSIHVVL